MKNNIKNDLLKSISKVAYNIGFGAKLNFASYDIIMYSSKLILYTFIATSFFILFADKLDIKILSAIIIYISVFGLYIDSYSNKKEYYYKRGAELLVLYVKLRKLYYSVKNSEKNSYEEEINSLSEIENLSHKDNLNDQILLSNWYAHYKFFWQFKPCWINSELNLKLLRDKIPISFSILIGMIALSLVLLFLIQN